MSEVSECADLTIVYDGDCFFCENYIRMQALKSNIGSVSLLDARANPAIVKQLSQAGMDINQGMAAHFDDRWYFGPECMTLLSILSDRSSLRGKIWRVLFINKTITAFMYPAFRTIRNFVIYLRGVKHIDTKNP